MANVLDSMTRLWCRQCKRSTAFERTGVCGTCGDDITRCAVCEREDHVKESTFDGRCPWENSHDKAS